MLNTCSIGRRWKSREGWSRPVLTGERGTLFPIPLGDWVSSCGGFLVGWQGTLFLVVTTILVRRFACVRCPVPGPPRPESVVWLVPLPADPGWGLAVQSGFAVVMAQVRRPVPFRTRKLRPGTAMVLHSRGCGRVARRRILSLDLLVESPTGFPEGLFLFAQGVFLRPVGDYGRRQAGLREDSSSGWRFSDCGRPVGVLVIPVSGGIWDVERCVGR